MTGVLKATLNWMQALFPGALGQSGQAQPGTLPPACIGHTPYGDRAYVSAGVGVPTVVFESGLGDGKEVWASVFRAVSKHTRVFAYDRAGYGQSAGSAQARDGHQMVEELRAVLKTANIPAPYVLVGHSLGGTLVKLFARMYPEEVAGVVLVDARAADFSKRCMHNGVLRMLYEPPLSWLIWRRTSVRRELEAVPLIQRQARRAGAFPHVPLLVLTHRSEAFHWPKSLAAIWAKSSRPAASRTRSRCATPWATT